jgi:hypothetical protein
LWLFTEQIQEFFHKKQIIILQHVFKHQIQWMLGDDI